MKKFLYIQSVLLLTLTTVHGQTNVYHPFPDSNAVWNINFGLYCFWNGTANENYSIIISGDTLINGQPYHKLTTPYVQSFSTGTCGGKIAGYKGAIRQDQPAKKVFFVPPLSNSEQLLYDFTMQVGDTVKGYAGSTNTPFLPDVILSIDSVLVGGNYRKRWKTDSYYNPYFIEGIGSAYGMIERSPGNVTDMPGYLVTCFSQNGITLHPATATNCDLILTSVSTIQENSSQVKISPNPSTGIFTIQNKEAEISYIEICNIFGEIVYAETVKSKMHEIKLEDKSRGIYFYKSVSGDKRISSGKLIIQ